MNRLTEFLLAAGWSYVPRFTDKEHPRFWIGRLSQYVQTEPKFSFYWSDFFQQWKLTDHQGVVIRSFDLPDTDEQVDAMAREVIAMTT